jgi:serine/threonine protein kinase
MDQVLGFSPVLTGHGSSEDDSYTAAVDMWALGEVIFRMLTQQPAFPSPYETFLYVTGKQSFDQQIKTLRDRNISDACCDFIGGLLKGPPQARFTARQAATHIWLGSFTPLTPARSNSKASTR